MGVNEIRTALKVDLKKPAAEQPGLHVYHGTASIYRASADG